MKVQITVFAVLFSLVLSLPGFSGANHPQPPLQSSGDGPSFFVDHADFRGIENKTYAEFYIQVPYDELQFIKLDDRFRARYSLTFEITDAGGKVVESENISDFIDVDTFAETVSPTKARVCLLAFTLTDEEHTVIAELRDHETTYSTRLRWGLSPRNFETSNLVVSDIQFSAKITPAGEDAAYVKNQRSIEPNPIKVFAPDLAEHLYVYFEIYNFALDQAEQSQTYTVYYTFHDAEGNQIARLRRQQQKPGKSSAHSLRFPVHHFDAGHYTLSVEVQDDETMQSASVTSGFQVLDPVISLSENRRP